MTLSGTQRAIKSANTTSANTKTASPNMPPWPGVARSRAAMSRVSDGGSYQNSGMVIPD